MSGNTTVSGGFDLLVKPALPRLEPLAVEQMEMSVARDSGDGFTIDLPRGTIDMMTPATFTRRYGQPAPDTAAGARLAAIRFTKARKAEIVPALGAVLAFEAI